MAIKYLQLFRTNRLSKVILQSVLLLSNRSNCQHFIYLINNDKLASFKHEQIRETRFVIQTHPYIGFFAVNSNKLKRWQYQYLLSAQKWSTKYRSIIQGGSDFQKFVQLKEYLRFHWWTPKCSRCEIKTFCF